MSGFGMSLSVICRTYSEMCFQSAATSQSAEIREQWTRLGEQWRKKAEADEHQDGPKKATPNTARTAVLDVTPTQKRPEAIFNLASNAITSALAQQKREATSKLADESPTLIPEGPDLQQKAGSTTAHVKELSDIWARIASPIDLER